MRRTTSLPGESDSNVDSPPAVPNWHILSLHDIRLDCHVCSRDAVLSDVEEREDGFRAYMRCPVGHCDFYTQRPEWSAFFEKHLHQQEEDSNYREWAAALLSWDSNRIIRFIEQLHSHLSQSATPPAAPFFRSGRLPDVDVLPKVDDVVSVLLAYPDFLLAPRPIDRAEEATVAALKRASTADVTRCAEWVGKNLNDEEWREYADSLSYLFGCARAGFNRGKHEHHDPPDAASIKHLLRELSRIGRRDDLATALQEWRRMYESLREQSGEEFADRIFDWWKGLEDFQL
jgi:hypothetical protein